MRESGKWKWSCSVLSDSSCPYGLQPTRLLRPWDFPGKSTGVGCHCLLQIWRSICLKPPSGQYESLLKIFCLYRVARKFLLKYTYRNYLGNEQAFKAISLLIDLSSCRSVNEQELEGTGLKADKFWEWRRDWKVVKDGILWGGHTGVAGCVSDGGSFFFFYLLFLSEVQSTYNVMLAKIWMKALGDWEMMGEREYDLGRSDSTNDKFISSSLDNDGLTIR